MRTDFGETSPSEEWQSTDPSIAARVKRALLTRIAADSTAQHVTVEAGDAGWQPFLKGIRCRVLFEHQDALTYLLELQAGAVLPAHRHPQDEECIVLKGSLRIGDALVLQEGDYHIGLAGVLHAQITTDHGALIFLRGAPPELSQCI